MDKREEVLQNKELNLKGIDTAESTEVKPSMNSTIPIEGENPGNPNEPVDPVDPSAEIDPVNPKHEKKSSSFLNWEDPKDEQESLEKGMSSSLGLTGGSSIAGDIGSFDTKQAHEAMAPINLGKYIPDPRERDKFLRENGGKLIQLDQQTYGITFENDIRDLVEFKQKDYPKRMKRFLDDLDDSQGFLSEMRIIGANFVGNTIVNTVGGVLNVAYGPLTALLTWDISKIYDNYLMDAVEWSQDWMSKHAVIYGGSDMYNIDPKTGDFVQKEFLARFASDPIKSLNQDLVPAASFIAGAILQEFAATLAAVPTGGTSLALSTANILSRGANMYRRILGTNKLYSSTMKAVRGLDDNLLQLSKLKNSAQFQNVQKTVGQIGNNVVGAYRSASFESAIIAREIQDTTYNNLLVEYHKNNGGEVDENGFPVGELIEPDSETLRRFEDLSKDAGNLGFGMNVPLVAGSRMIQFPRIFGRNMSSANISNKILGSYSGTGTRIVNGRRVANVDASKGLKAFGYTRDVVSKPVSEAWEEFAQEAISGGLTSYYTSSYSKDSAATITGAIGGVVDQMSHVMDSAEGRDSVTIGALMGALGIWLPIKLNKTTGKPSFSLKGEVMGGIYGGFQDTKSRHDKAREAAGYMNENLNENNVNVPLSEYFNSYVKHSAAQKEMDEAISKGDKMSYKNAEHKQLFSYVHSKVNQGVGDLILEDIKKERELTLDEFNKRHAHEQDEKFTEETKKEAIDKAEARVSKMIKDIGKVQTLVENNAHMGANKIAYWFRKKAGQDVHKPLTATELQNAKGLQEQVAYLYSSVENSKEREISLIDSIKNQTEGEFNFGILDQIKATAKGIVPVFNLSEGKEVLGHEVGFIDDHKEVVKLALNEWKKTDLESYNKYSESIKEDLADIVKLKIQRAKAAEMYKGMFTYKGAKAFRELSYELAEARAKEILKNYKEKIEKDAKNKKNAKLSSVKTNEASINNGQSPIVDAKEENEIRKGLKELEELNPEALSSEAYYQEVLDILDKYPGFMSFVHREGIKRGLPLENSYTGQEILALDAEDPSRTVEAGIMNIVNDIRREFKDYESDPKNAPDFESENEYDQPSSDEIITDGTTEENTVDVEKVSVNSDNIIYINVDHKQLKKLDNGKVVAIREEDGTLRNNPAVNNPDYKVDYEKVNSTGFLNNETLESENHEFEFRIPEDNTYNLTESESIYDMWIDVVHVDPVTGEETNIGTLQAYRENDPNSPQSLKELREEIVRRDDLMKNQKVDPEIEALKKKRQDIKNKLREASKKEKQSSSSTSTGESTTSETSQDSFDVGSELSISARKKLNKLGFTDSILSVMSKEDVETAKTFSSKEDSGLKELIDKYNTEDSSTSQVQDLAGNTYSVNESDITTYETESGPIRYITNENGDMVMLSDKDTSNKDKYDIVEKIENLTPKAREHYETAKKTHPNRTLEDVRELQEMVDSLTNSPKDKAIKKGVQLFIEEVNYEINQLNDSTTQEQYKPNTIASTIFEIEPELANEVYEALGFNDKEITIGKGSIDHDNFEGDIYPIKINGEYAGSFTITKRHGVDKLPMAEQGFISGSIGSYGIELESEFQGKGYGERVYLQIAKELSKEGITLKSEFFGKDNIGGKANSVWQKLVNEGYAVDKGEYFEVVNPYTPQQKQQAQQLYSQYISQNPNGNIEGFKSWVDNNQSNVQYQLPQGREQEEFVASEKTIRDLAARMSDRIGIPVKFESDRTKEYKGKLENGTAVVNLAYASLDTPIHEILGHPIIRAIKYGEQSALRNTILTQIEKSKERVELARKKRKKEITKEEYKKQLDLIESKYTKKISQLYQNLLKELEYGKGKEILDRIKRDYVYKSDKIVEQNKKQLANWKADLEKNPNDKVAQEWVKNLEQRIKEQEYTLEEQQEEAVVELLGLMTAEKLDKVKDGKLISLLKRLLKEMKQFVRSLINQKEVEIDKLPDNMTLGDIADLLAYSNSKLILPGNEVVYTTPDNQQFKTYQEASNHISELAKSVEDVDLSNIAVPKGIPDNFTYIDGNGDKHTFNKINENEYEHIYSTPVKSYNRQILNRERYVNTIKQKGINSFIEKNKEYEQSKEIIEEWKKVNNIQYNPEEVYSRGQEFVSVVGAYSDFDVNLMMQNLLQHIEDNQKAGGEFTISAFTKPIDRNIGHLEGGRGKIKFKIHPQSQDIKWAANTDVYSGSVWDASEKVNKDKKSELLGVSYTKYPSLQNVNKVQPNLASIIDDLAHHHNELGISLTGNNFRLEYDKDIPYTTKKIIDSINSILDQKYGKLVKPEITTKDTGKVVYRVGAYFSNKSIGEFNSKEEAQNFINNYKQENSDMPFKEDLAITPSGILKGIQPTQTNETLKESIEGIKNKLGIAETGSTRSLEAQIKYKKQEIAILDGILNTSKDSTRLEESQQKKEQLLKDIEILQNKIDNPDLQKEYTEQALINTKVSKLKEVAKKYPRSLIRSEVRSITSTQNNYGFDETELPFQKINPRNNEEIESLKQELSEVNKQLSEAMNKDLVFKTETENKTAEELLKGIDEYNTISPLDKTERKRFLDKLNEEFGEDKVNRIMAIENNFDDIVAQLVSSGINVFTPNEGKFEEC